MEERLYDLSICCSSDYAPGLDWISYHYFLKNDDSYTEISFYGTSQDIPLNCAMWTYSRKEFEDWIYRLLFDSLSLLTPEEESEYSLNLVIETRGKYSQILNATYAIGTVNGSLAEIPNDLNFIQVSCREDTTIFSELPKLGEFIKQFTECPQLKIKIDRVKETLSCIGLHPHLGWLQTKSRRGR